MNFYKHYIGDFQRDTGHLSLTQRGAYLCLMHHYYATEKPLPNDHAALCRIAGAIDKAERDAVRVVMGFFMPVDSGLMHKRIEAEIEKAGKQADTNRQIAIEREARRKAEREDHEQSTNRATNREPNQTPDTNKEIPSNLTVAPAFPPENRPPLALVDSAAKAKGPPDCPHLAVLALWAEVLPAMPQHNPSLWRGTRSTHLRARWRETAAEKGWATEAEGLAYLRRLFGYVGASAFLTGKAASRGGGRPFVVELEWLVNPTNWAKVIEGKYHTEQAA